MTRPTHDRYGGEEVRENKSLEHLVELQPVVFDPDPSGSDMPEPNNNSDSPNGEGANEPGGTAS